MLPAAPTTEVEEVEEEVCGGTGEDGFGAVVVVVVVVVDEPNMYGLLVSSITSFRL